ncbi:hypothetical protein TCARB_0099 [Thermofilum adornatum 1505]|uniref:Uncharacterized protein n=1 Tax=Thermofilum adornatum 1505 TaxID=697581 RepID=A0A3G1A780_9CREN|nr:hypothetical protein TCARB_0099 [Thermofilum adornatum 1505]
MSLIKIPMAAPTPPIIGEKAIENIAGTNTEGQKRTVLRIGVNRPR